MKVSSSSPTIRYHLEEGDGKVEVQFAMQRENGNSSAGEKYDFQEDSVRLAWWNKDGAFDPISSGELPKWGMLDLVELCAEHDFFDKKELYTIIGLLTESLERQKRT
ncbi:hypothetical protein [Marinomonas gallaica]|uniref:hypothetical protein n=1 Tax=Marinomonas gallaica TaxID=1806667 RepID=UPI003A944349